MSRDEGELVSWESNRVYGVFLTTGHTLHTASLRLGQEQGMSRDERELALGKQ